MRINLRPMLVEDIPSVVSIIEDNDLFPSEYLEEMTAKYFSGSQDDKWFVAQLDDNKVVGVAYACVEIMTDKTWNLLLIAILTSYQNKQIGRVMLASLESELKSNDARIVLIETSSLPHYEPARRCYQKSDYQHIATVPDYYENGEDKLIYLKKLQGK